MKMPEPRLIVVRTGSPVGIAESLRSLYPSVIIAYNYCYSTCLGPTRTLGAMLRGERGGHRFGCLELSARGFCTAEEAQKHRTPAAQRLSPCI